MSTTEHNGTPPAGALTTPFVATNDYCSTGTYRFYSSICMPMNWEAYWSGKVGYYSPAICPQGYYSAGQPNSILGPRIETTETAIACCPSGYFYDRGATSYCYSNYATRASSIVRSTTTLAASTSISTSYSSYTTEARSTAYVIQVRWAASDLPILATNPLEPGKVSQNTSTPIPTPEPGPGGLSTGAKIGIGVGVPLGLILLAAVGFLFWCFRRRGKGKKEATEEVANQYSAEPKVEVDKPELYGSEAMVAPPAPVYEVPGDTYHNTAVNPAMSNPGSSQLTPGMARASMASSVSPQTPSAVIDPRFSSQYPEVVPSDPGYQR